MSHNKDHQIGQDIALRAVEDIAHVLQRHGDLLENNEQRSIYAVVVLINMIQLEAHRVCPTAVETMERISYRDLIVDTITTAVLHANERDRRVMAKLKQREAQS